MRSHSELIQVMLDHINLLKYGLCGYVNIILDLGFINGYEAEYLRDYLSVNLPKRKYAVLGDAPVYSFPIGDIPSREKWLREQL